MPGAPLNKTRQSTAVKTASDEEMSQGELRINEKLLGLLKMNQPKKKATKHLAQKLRIPDDYGDWFQDKEATSS